jgi:hypothetical protein
LLVGEGGAFRSSHAKKVRCWNTKSSGCESAPLFLWPTVVIRTV